VVGEGRIRVENDPALCGRLNEKVGHLLWCDRTSGYILFLVLPGFRRQTECEPCT
jgi:hypothetical protein